MSTIQIIGLIVVALLGLYVFYCIYDLGRRQKSEDRRKNKNKALTMALLFASLFAGQNAWAQLTWEVTSSTSNHVTTFTITRSGSYLPEQIVGYRTISLSAIEGQHFYAANDTLIFREGWTSRSVTVTEKTNPSGMYKYQEGTTRSYRFEVYDHNGVYLAHINRSMTTGSSVASTAFQENTVNVQTSQITVTDAGYAQAYYAVPLTTYFNNTAPQAYFTALDVQLRMLVTFDAREKSDGYQYIQIIHNNTTGCDTGAKDGDPGTIRLSRYMAGFTIDGNVSSTFYPYTFPLTSKGSGCGAVTHPWPNNSNGNLKQQYFNTNCRATDGRLIIPTNLNTLGIRFDASGNLNDDWYAKNVKAKIQAIDGDRPTILSTSDIVVSDGIYKKGNTVYVSIPFSEIVVTSGTPSLSTTWGTFSYFAGSGSNVLTFSGTISNTASLPFRITAINVNNTKTIKDRSGNAFNSTLDKIFSNKTVATTYDITYTLGDATLPGGLSNPTTYCNQSLDITLVNPEAPIGYHFIGWTGSNGNTPQTTVTIAHGSTGNRNYTANIPVNTYTVHFDKNATSATGTMADQQFTYGQAQHLTANAFVFTGHTFQKWNTSADGSGTDYTDGQEVSNLSAIHGDVVNLYAQWPIDQYTISYELNGGTLPSNVTNPTSYTVESGNITLNNPIRLGFRFDGWTGSNGNTPQTTVTITPGSMMENLNYIANWTDVWNVGGGADGSELNPYMISSTAGLDLIASLVNSGNLNTDMYFSQTNDITYSHDGLGPDESNFTSIGTSSNPFGSIFNGNGHCISGIRIRRGNEDNQGLFGYIYDGYVEGIILDDVEIVGKNYTGGIAGRTTGGTTIRDCTVNSNVTIRASELASCHGGIIGSLAGSTDWISDCISRATLTAVNTSSTQNSFGGIVGYCNGRVYRCFANGVTMPSLSNCGAIIGKRDNYSTLTDNYYINCHVGDNTTNIGTGTGDYTGAKIVYVITIENPEQGTINALGVLLYDNNVYSASGKWINLSISINNPILEVDYYTVNGTPIDGTVFAMPAENTTVSAVLKQICPQPTDLTVTAIGDQTADITWDTSDLVEVTDWQICLNDDEEHLINVHSTTTAYHLTGLTNDTYYTVKIRSACSEGNYSDWSDDEAFEPTNSIIVGSGSDTDPSLPTDTYRYYSLTQQIYDPSELGAVGDIKSIAFYSLSDVTRSLDIYMMNTNKTVFQTTNDWVNFSSADLVFSGEVSFIANQWTTINFDDVFVYDGTSHVVLVVDDNTKEDAGEIRFKAFKKDANEKALNYAGSDDLNATNIGTCYGSTSNYRNQLRVSKVAHSDCLKPRNFTATEITAHTAVLDWTESGASTQWVVSYNGTEVTVNTHPYTLQNLNSATKYKVKVRPTCGEDLWSSTISFTTIESCLKPTDFVANTVTNNSATLSWTENNGASNWQLIVDYDINHLINISSSDVTIDGQTVSYTLTGLESERSYTVMVRACCDEQDQSIWSDAIKFETTNKLIVGNGTTYSLCLPTNFFYNYSLTQQIYTTQELGDTGYYIEGIDFQVQDGNKRNMDIYIVSIDKEITAFSDRSLGMVSVTPNDRVFSGSVSFAPDAWTPIKFDNSYYYDGKHNIVLVVDDNSGSYSNSSGFLAFNTSGQAIYVCSDNIDFNPADPNEYSFISIEKKNCIRILRDISTCGRPQHLTVSDITSHGATFTWDKEDGDAFQYGIASATTPESGFNPSNSTNENTVTLDNLTPERQYVFYIRKDCGNGDYSKYTTINFSTLESCYAPTDVNLDDITNSSVIVNWTGDNDSYAVSYRTPAHLGSTYVERFDSSSMPANWSSYKGQLNNDGTADLVKNDSWQFQEDHDVFDNHAVGNIYNTNSWWLVTPSILINGEFGLHFDLAFTNYDDESTDPDLDGYDDRFMVLVSMDDMKHWTKLREWNNSGSSYVLNEISTTGQQEFINLSAYDGSKVYIAFSIESVDNNADNNVHIDNVSFGGLEGGGPWQTIVSATTASSLDITNLTSNTPYEIKIQGRCGDNGLSHEVYATFTTEPSCFVPKRLSCYNIMPRSVDLSWMSDADAWQICFNGDENNLVEANSNPFTLSGLTPETQYTMKVRAVCGNNEYGDWSDGISFTTDVPYPKPAELTVSAVHSTGATVTWKGIGDSYELQYVKIENSSKGPGDTHKYSFDDETLNGWTTIDADGDGFNWVSATRIINSYSDYSCGGQGCCVVSQSYDSPTYTALTPDNYLVSPQILLGGSISFYACATDAEYPSEHFGVAVSLNSNDKASDFNTIQEWTMTAKNRSQGSWYKFTIDLSDYDGSLGYVAIRHFNVSDMFYLQVDEITLVEGGNNLVWVQASNATSPFLLNGLDPNSYYYVRVKANYANNMESPWSNASLITTAPGSIKVDGYGNGNDGWAFIATPVADGSNPGEVGNLIADPINNYDLYRLNPSSTMWENYKNTSEHADFTTLVNGQGYLYANKNDVTLSFSGTYNTADSKEVELRQGFNLVGNPFAVPAYVSRSYYRMNAEGTDVEAVAAYTTTSIPACTGVVVKADGQNEKVTFSTTAPVSSNGDNGGLQLTLSQTVATRGGTTLQITDKAIVSFNEGSRLAKYIFRENNAKLYFTQNGEDYAIAYSDGVGEMPLNFKARENGEYTLTVTISDNVIASAAKQSIYVHLIDNLTGSDIDLLATPSYTFSARNDDYASRFKLVFSNQNQNDNENEDFAFISNGEIIVNGEGTVQVIDLLGHILVAEDANRRISTEGLTPGVYVLRIINGENVKTQKIVIR